MVRLLYQGIIHDYDTKQDDIHDETTVGVIKHISHAANKKMNSSTTDMHLSKKSFLFQLGPCTHEQHIAIKYSSDTARIVKLKVYVMIGRCLIHIGAEKNKAD